VREFALYGETTGEIDELGLPVRIDWAAEYRGTARVIYGHTPVAEPSWLNRTINVDTGCVFGGRLTALRYPELELVSVPARMAYAGTPRPFLAPVSALTAQQEQDDVLDLEDVLGKRMIHTRLRNDVTIREENAAAALEAMSRFAAHPKWLVYLPPTMSPSETSRRPDLLEHPEEALAYYRAEGIDRVVCEEKHMGSRAVVVVCRDEEVARQRFGVAGEGIGLCHTRTGRRFFDDARLEQQLLGRVRDAFESTGLWDRLGTGWACLDCELMPWSAKAQDLLREQYAAVGAAARTALPKAIARLAATAGATSSPAGSWTPTGATAGPSPRSPACASRLSTCWLQRAPSTWTRTTPGTWRFWRKRAGPIRTCSFPRPGGPSTWATPAVKPRRSPGGRS
jgi:protein phosphatase